MNKVFVVWREDYDMVYVESVYVKREEAELMQRQLETKYNGQVMTVHLEEIDFHE